MRHYIRKGNYMKKIIKSVLVLGLTLFLVSLVNYPISAYVEDRDLPAPTQVKVSPEKTAGDTVSISWKPIEWPELRPTQYYESLDSKGYMVFYSKDGEHWNTKWVSNGTVSSYEEADHTYIDGLEPGAYQIYVCAATKRSSRLNEGYSGFVTSGKASKIKKCKVIALEYYHISDTEVIVGKKKTINITTNTGIPISVEPLNILAQNNDYVVIKEGKTTKISFSKTAKPGTYYFKSSIPGFSKTFSILVHNENTKYYNTYELSKRTVKAGKQSTVKIKSNDWDTKLTIEPENELAKNAKNVTIKNGKTGKITFSKAAKKGTYEFKISISPLSWLTTYETVFITVS